MSRIQVLTVDDHPVTGGYTALASPATMTSTAVRSCDLGSRAPSTLRTVRPFLLTRSLLVPSLAAGSGLTSPCLSQDERKRGGGGIETREAPFPRF